MEIFLSSTYEDLKDIRKVAVNYLNDIVGETTNATGEVVAMEFFDASERTCKEECLHKLSSCDLVIGIYADRYGTVNSDGRSMTEIEFDYATEQGIPILAFVKRAICRDEREEKFIKEKVFGRNKSCANFETTEDFITRLNESLKAYLNEFDGYSIKSLWDEIQYLKDAINGVVDDGEIHHLQMEPYSANDTDFALEAIYESAKYLAGYEKDLYKEHMTVYSYAYKLERNPDDITESDKAKLCNNVKKNTKAILRNWDKICAGLHNQTSKIILAAVFLKYKRLQERLLTENWTEKLRQEVLRAKEEYIDTINTSHYID